MTYATKEEAIAAGKEIYGTDFRFSSSGDGWTISPIYTDANNEYMTQGAYNTAYPATTTQTPAATTENTGAGTDTSAEEIARQKWEAAKQQAANYRNQGQQTFDTLLRSVNAFRDRSKTGFENAGQQITDTASNVLGGNARTAQELQGTTRALGRSMGLGDSSRFNAQNRVLGNLAASQGQAIATRGQNDRNNMLNLEANNAEAQKNEEQANTYLQNIGNEANTIEQGGRSDYDSMLNNIVQYQRELAAMKPMNAGSVANYAPNFADTASSSLALKSSGLSGATPTGATAGGATNLASSLNLQDILRRTKGLYTSGWTTNPTIEN